MKSTKPVTPVALKLDADLKRRLQALAESRQRSAHWLMKEAVAQFVHREEQHEAFRSDALKAWAEFRETGLHISAKEADAWLAQLEKGLDVEPPTPHV